MSLACSILSPSDREWHALVTAVESDVYSLPDYALLAAAGEAASQPCAIEVRAKVGILLLPMLRRELADGLWDAASPYGYPGVVVTPGLESAQVTLMLEEACRFLGSVGCVSMVLRLHPKLNEPYADALSVGAEFRYGAETVVLDLGAGEEHLRAGLRGTHRHEIAKAERGGLVSSIDGNLARLSEFRDLYEQDMRRVGAADSYFFSDAYYERLGRLPAGSVSLRLAMMGEEIAAASLFFSRAGFLGYHLSTTALKFRKLSPAKHLIWNAAMEGVASGARWLHLGGGVRSGDSLFNFKAGFSAERWTYRLLGFVTNRDGYSRLCVAHADSGRAGSYFPLYRAPVPSPAGEDR